MKCQKCSTKVIEYPTRNQNGSINWKNLLIGNPIYTLFFISIVLIIFGVNQYTESCTVIREEPMLFCEPYCEYNQYVTIEPQYNLLPSINVSLNTT